MLLCPKPSGIFSLKIQFIIIIIMDVHIGLYSFSGSLPNITTLGLRNNVRKGFE